MYPAITYGKKTFLTWADSGGGTEGKKKGISRPRGGRAAQPRSSVLAGKKKRWSQDRETPTWDSREKSEKKRTSLPGPRGKKDSVARGKPSFSLCRRKKKK